MPPIRDYLEHADTLAQEVVNACGLNMRAGNAALLTDEFKDLFDKACRYRTAKSAADNRREFAMLSEPDEYENTTRQVFAHAYKYYRETLRRA